MIKLERCWDKGNQWVKSYNDEHYAILTSFLQSKLLCGGKHFWHFILIFKELLGSPSAHPVHFGGVWQCVGHTVSGQGALTSEHHQLLYCVPGCCRSLCGWSGYAFLCLHTGKILVTVIIVQFVGIFPCYMKLKISCMFWLFISMTPDLFAFSLCFLWRLYISLLFQLLISY